MKERTLLSITGLLAITFMFGVNLAQAQTIGHPGGLDTTFGTGGMVTINLAGSGGSVSPLTAIEQSNGDIAVVTGLTEEFSGEVFALVRLTPSGTEVGTTTASFFTNGFSSPSALAVQSNGDIVVAGTASPTIDGAQVFAIARFTPTGQLDATFGTGGLVTTDISGPFPAASAVLVQPNGQILVGGFVDGINKNSPGKTVLVRYNANGSLDTTFGTGGIVEETTEAASPAALAELANGSYLVVGGSAPSSVEFSSTGVLQSTVTPGTLAAVNSQSGTGCCSPVVFQPNGDYVVAQTVSTGGHLHTDVKASRFLETGVVDTSFSSTRFTFGGNTENEPQAIALQSNGQIVVGGITNAHGTPVTGGLARLDSNGDLDTTFANDGGLVSQAVVSGLLIQTDGKIVAIGNNGQLAVARYFAN
ncbi:MAG: hypothetical protein WCC25_06820 [Candidatus Korobacteraceae bacterium]